MNDFSNRFDIDKMCIQCDEITYKNFSNRSYNLCESCARKLAAIDISRNFSNLTDLEMMSNSIGWRQLTLPIKRYNEDNELQFGCLYGDGPEVFLVNIWELPSKNVESIKYNSYEEIIEEGWRVD